MTLEQLAKKLNYWGALYGVDAELYVKLLRKAKKSRIATRIDKTVSVTVLVSTVCKAENGMSGTTPLGA